MAAMLVITVLVTALDLGAKYATQAWLGAQRLVVWPGVLELRLAYNNGMSFGLLAGNVIANVALPVALMVYAIHLMRKYAFSRYKFIASGLVLGGFAGNYFQRLTVGHVVDMIYFPFLPWFVCNIADIAIFVGMLLLFASLLLRPQDWREKNEADKDVSER